MTQSATNRDMFIDDPIDLNGDYTDIEDPQPQNQMHKNEIGKARLRGFMVHGRILFQCSQTGPLSHCQVIHGLFQTVHLLINTTIACKSSTWTWQPVVGANKPNCHHLPHGFFFLIDSYFTPILCHQHHNDFPLHSGDSHATSLMTLALTCTYTCTHTHSHSHSHPHPHPHSCSIPHTHIQILSCIRTCIQSACNHMHPCLHHSSHLFNISLLILITTMISMPSTGQCIIVIASLMLTLRSYS